MIDHGFFSPGHLHRLDSIECLAQKARSRVKRQPALAVCFQQTAPGQAAQDDDAEQGNEDHQCYGQVDACHDHYSNRRSDPFADLVRDPGGKICDLSHVLIVAEAVQRLS